MTGPKGCASFVLHSLVMFIFLSSCYEESLIGSTSAGTLSQGIVKVMTEVLVSMLSYSLSFVLMCVGVISMMATSGMMLLLQGCLLYTSDAADE